MLYSSRFLEVDIPDSFWHFQKLPLATKALTSVTILFSAAHFVIRWNAYNNLDPTAQAEITYRDIAVPVLQMVPDTMLKFPMSILLSNFVDIDVWKFVINMLNLTIGGAFIERNWGSSKELIKFTVVLGTITNLLVVLFTVGFSFIIPGVKLYSPIDGNYTILIGFPIIYKQLLPETTIFQIKNIPFLSTNFRFKLLPIFVISIATIVQLVWLHHFAQLISIWLTFVSSWVYLRFFQTLSLAGDIVGSENALSGDASDTFQFIYLFPDLVKPILRPMFDVTYNIVCVKLKIIRPFESSDIDKSNSVAHQRGAKEVDSGTPGEIFERQKQKALEILQERMA